MDLTEYISISGQGGLYKVIAKSTNGLIVESLADKKRIHINAAQKVSALQDISIFTTGEDIPLSDVFMKIHEKENGGEAINHKAEPEQLKKYFGEVLPDYDSERVYTSDMKKVIQWYNILQSNNLVKFEDAAVSDEAGADEESEEKSSKSKTGDKGKEEKSAAKKTASKTAKAAPKTKDSTPKTSKAKAGKTQTVRKTGA
jgi:hypothetical protein